MKTKRSGKMAYVLQSISIIPLILFGLVILLLSMQLITDAMYKEVEQELRGTARNVVSMLDKLYPGDYHLEGEVSYSLFKGEHDLTREYDLADQFKENCGCEVTLFYKDTSILTTIYDQYGERIIGKGAAGVVVRDILEQGNSSFYPNTMVFDVKYFCYYVPLKNADGSNIGMILVAKPSDQVNSAIRGASYPLLIVVLIVALIIGVCIHLYTKQFDQILQHIRTFLSEVATGNLTAELDPMVLRRNDEFGDIGRSAVQMQQAIRHTVETDALTELYNRRSGERRLRQIMEKSSMNGTPYAVSIGDIDFFKKVNDTYGHACGDLVLKSVSEVLRKHMVSTGFAARWGGEEFLIVFDRTSLRHAEKALQDLLEEIRQLEIPYEDKIVRVTMTFGLVAGEAGSDQDTLIRLADDKLYLGKTGGRNRVIV